MKCRVLLVTVLGLVAQAPGLAAQDAGDASRITFSFRDGSDTVEFTLRDDEVHVSHNGEAADEDRFRRSGNSVQWLDARGNVRANLMLYGSRGGTLNVLPRVRSRLSLGLNVAPLGEALAEHLGVAADEALLVSGVVEDKAAARGGLRKNDVITRVDGEKVAGRATLTEAVQDKEAGDALEFVVLRRGKKETVRVELIGSDWESAVGSWLTDYSFPAWSPQFAQKGNFAFGEAAKSFAWPRFQHLENDYFGYLNRNQAFDSSQPQLYRNFLFADRAFGDKCKVVDDTEVERIEEIAERIERLEEMLRGLGERKRKDG